MPCDSITPGSVTFLLTVQRTSFDEGLEQNWRSRAIEVVIYAQKDSRNMRFLDLVLCHTPLREVCEEKASLQYVRFWNRNVVLIEDVPAWHGQRILHLLQEAGFPLRFQRTEATNVLAILAFAKTGRWNNT